ncbi:hypothetical protein C0991_006957 [Blastosporella zonata]|nr:hypothetical protein C0991_006957 [Blastosporella zonata]
MPSTTSSRIPWLVLFLALPWNGVAQDPTPYLAPRQDTPILAFIGLFDAQLTSCTSTSFNWVYSGPDASLSLFISNQSVSQDTTTVAPTALTDKRSIRSLHVRDTVDIPIASMISPTLDGFNLTSLAVSPGDYQLIAIVATVPPYLAYSPTFTVQQGSDTSCLTSSPSSSSSSSTSSFTLSFPTTTSDISTITSTVSSSASASTSSSIVAPIGAVSSTPVNKGAIAGGVVAGVIISLAVIAFYYFFSRHRRTRAHARAPTDSHPSNGAFDVGTASGGNIGGRWGGLGSVDSHAPLSDPKVQKPYVSTRHRASQDEINFYRSRSGSVPHGGYTGSPSEEKFGGSPPEEMVLSTMPYRSPSSNAHASKNNVRSYSTSSMAPSEHPRRGSQSQARRPSLDSSASHAQSPFATPPASSPESFSNCMEPYVV